MNRGQIALQCDWLGCGRPIAAMVIGMTLMTPAVAADSSDAGADKWAPWFEVGGFYNSRDDDGRGSFGTSRGETSVFVPITGGPRSLLFGQATAKFFQDDAREGNIAVGYRRMSTSRFNFGAWLGADVRYTEIGNRFWQMSGGFEALSHNFDARLNWYGPTTSPQAGAAGFTALQFTGTQLFMVGSEEVALKGVDGEVGVRLPLEYASLDPRLFELRAYAGGYYFDDKDSISPVKGVKGRIELRLNDVIAAVPGSRLTAEYEVSHDDVRDTRHEVGLRVRIPLSGRGRRPATALAALSGQERRMLDGIERDTDIVTTRSKEENVSDNLTGVNFDRVAVVGDGGSVTATSAAAGANSLLIVNGTVSGAQTLQGNQTLQSGDSTILVRGRRSGIVLPFTAPGAAGRLTAPGTDNDNLTLLGSNTHLSGLTVVGDGPAGVGDGVDVGSNKSNVFIVGLFVRDTGGDGIDIDDNNQVTINDLRTRETDESGIDANDGNQLTINDGSVINAGSDGVQIDDDNRVTITGLTITNASRDGIAMDENNVVSITGATISNPGVDGVFFVNGNTVNISNSTISNPGDDGLFFVNGNTVTLRNVTINGPGDDGIELREDNSLTVIDSTIAGTDYGLFVNGSNGVITITGTTFSAIEEDAILIAFGTTNTRLDVINATFTGIGSDVFFVDAPATILISGTRFAGTIGSDVFDFEDAVVIATGSTGNINNATIGDRLCEADGFGSFTGSIIFVDGTTLQDNVAPCD